MLAGGLGRAHRYRKPAVFGCLEGGGQPAACSNGAGSCSSARRSTGSPTIHMLRADGAAQLGGQLLEGRQHARVLACWAGIRCRVGSGLLAGCVKPRWQQSRLDHGTPHAVTAPARNWRPYSSSVAHSSLRPAITRGTCMRRECSAQCTEGPVRSRDRKGPAQRLWRCSRRPARTAG